MVLLPHYKYFETNESGTLSLVSELGIDVNCSMLWMKNLIEIINYGSGLGNLLLCRFLRRALL